MGITELLFVSATFTSDSVHFIDVIVYFNDACDAILAL